MLARLLLEQRQAAARWQTEFIASMTSSISAFNTSQDELLQRNIGAVQSELGQANTSSAKKGKAREAAFTQLGEGVKECYDDLGERCGRVRKIARLHTEESTSSCRVLIALTVLTGIKQAWSGIAARPCFPQYSYDSCFRYA